MALNDIIRNGVALAHNIVGSLEVTVQHLPWIGVTDRDAAVYGSAVPRQALVDQNRKVYRNANNDLITETTQVYFLFPIAPNGAAGRQEPVDPRDKIILPNGFTSQIVNVGGFFDPASGYPYLFTVSLG